MYTIKLNTGSNLIRNQSIQLLVLTLVYISNLIVICVRTFEGEEIQLETNL